MAVKVKDDPSRQESEPGSHESFLVQLRLMEPFNFIKMYEYYQTDYYFFSIVNEITSISTVEQD